MISSIGINNNSYKKYSFTNNKVAKSQVVNNSTNPNVYNPGFYPILPKQISFGSAQSAVIEELKNQKLSLILENTNIMKTLRVFKHKKEEAVLEICKKMGMDVDNIDRSALPELLSWSKTEIKKTLSRNFEGISFLDSKIQNASGKYSSGLDIWETAMDKEVAGFAQVKKNLLNQYLKPVLDEKNGINARVPSGVVLYGHEGMMKENFALSLSQQAGTDIEFIEPSSDNFISEIELILNNAKKTYQEDRTRTIICVNKIDELADTNPNSQKIVDYLKTRLDNCSKTPDEHNQGYASTFFFMASDPNKIHKDLRRGKIGDFIGINPTSTDYIKDMFKFKLNSLDVDSDVLDYERLIQLTKPDETKGAFSSSALDKIFDISLNVAMEDKQHHFQSYLEYGLNKFERDISPEEYKKIRTIERKLEAPTRSQEEIDRLKREMGIQD